MANKTKHLSICPVYGSDIEDDEPYCCSEITKDEYIKRLELKIDLMKFYVSKKRMEDIDKKVKL